MAKRAAAQSKPQSCSLRSAVTLPPIRSAHVRNLLQVRSAPISEAPLFWGVVFCPSTFGRKSSVAKSRSVWRARRTINPTPAAAALSWSRDSADARARTRGPENSQLMPPTHAYTAAAAVRCRDRASPRSTAAPLPSPPGKPTQNRSSIVTDDGKAPAAAASASVVIGWRISAQPEHVRGGPHTPPMARTQRWTRAQRRLRAGPPRGRIHALYSRESPIRERPHVRA